MRYSTLSNNMMISKLWMNNYNSNTVVKQGFAVVTSQASWWVGSAHDRHNSAPELAEHHPPDHAESISD
jgi:hypothetical protein